MCWNCHHCARSVVTEYIISNPEWNRFSVKWIDNIRTSENSRFFFSFIGTILVRSTCRFCDIRLTLCGLFISDEVIYTRMVWGKNCICHTIDRINTSGIYRDKLIYIIRFSHLEFAPFTLPYPILLHLFDAFWPIKSFKIINQSICIFCNLEYPLTKSPFLDTGSTSITSIESGHFFIRKTCFTAWTIVYRKILLIGKSSLEKLKKYPLCPLIIFWICRIYHTIPII